MRLTLLAKEYDFVIPALPRWASFTVVVVMAIAILVVVWLVMRNVRKKD